MAGDLILHIASEVVAARVLLNDTLVTHGPTADVTTVARDSHNRVVRYANMLMVSSDRPHN